MTLITSKRKKHNFSNNNNSGTNYQNNGNQGQGNHYTKSNHQEKPVNVSATLNRPVSKEQLYKIQEVLRHPLQCWDRLKLEDQPATGEYTKSFNKFHPKKVEVNEATVEEAIKFGQYLKRSEEDIAEVIDIYVMQLRSGDDPRLQGTLKNASYQGGWAAK